MKPILKFTFYILSVWVLVHSSCKKKIPCEGCLDGNKPPIAIAGPDQVVTLPIDSVLLDGTASNDPDGSINKWLWTKISGPISFNINSAALAKTTVKNLVAGTYLFELTVKDDGGISATDTIKVIVNDPRQSNRPPVANAGADQTITLPTNTVNLDGGSTTDPDNNIVFYLWIKISGPSAFIFDAHAIRTRATYLVEGIYQFELRVVDTFGLYSIDTMQVTVNASVVTGPCINRPEVNATLIPIGSLSVARYGLVSASAGSKILFAGGLDPNTNSSRVDIYDTATNNWSTAELTIARRDGMTVATVGNKIFFAGGGDNGGTYVTSRVDIYDAATNTWATAELSQPRRYLAAATLGTKIFFAGGGTWGPIPCCLPPGWPANVDYYVGSNVVDIYDNETNYWTTAILSEGRFELSATTAGNKIYFAGGFQSIFSGSNKIDIYDAVTGTWSTSQIQEIKASHAGIAFNNKILWAAGANGPYQAYNLSGLVEVRDITSGVSSFDCITPKSMFGTTLKNEIIVFFTGHNGPGNKFDIYNTTTNSWSIGVLPVNIYGSSVISVNNTIYVAGGEINGIYSNQVWKLEF